MEDGDAINVFIEKCLVPPLWSGAVVVMDNLPAHKMASIEPLIKAVRTCLIYHPISNPIEQWWSQLKSFLRQFSPTTTKWLMF